MAPKSVAEFSLDKTRADTVDSNLVVQKFFCEYLGQSNEHSFGDCVMTYQIREIIGRITSQDDDGAIRLYLEIGKRFLYEEERAFVIDVQHFLDLILLSIDECSHLSRDSCIRYQVINLPIFLNSFLDKICSICFFPNMTNNSMSLKSLAFDFMNSFFNVLFISAGNDDVNPFLGQTHSDGLADSCARGSNNGNFAFHKYDIVIGDLDSQTIKNPIIFCRFLTRHFCSRPFPVQILLRQIFTQQKKLDKQQIG